MATFPAVASTTAALIKLLEGAAHGTEFDQTSFLQHRSADLQEAGSDKSAVSFYLYHVNVNASRRTAPDTWAADGTRRPAILPLDLHYLMTAWAKNALNQQRLLGWAMRVIQDTPTLPAGLLNAHEPDVFGLDETVEVIWEPLSPRDLYDIWDVARSRQQPSAAYVARVVEIASTLQPVDGPLVQTRELQYGGVGG